jgi:DNA-binding GntR family transcriptional regulator
MTPSQFSIADDRANMPLSEAVFRALCRAFEAGLYRPGDRLREDEVAQALETSRTPVREAFGRLVAKGLVQSSGGRGLVVRSLDQTEILELYAMREMLEGAAARLAAQFATSPEVDAMRSAQARFAASSDPQELARVNRQFHAAVYRAARNRYLDRALDDLQISIALLGPTTFEVEGRVETAVTEHEAIIRAIVERDADQAESLARSHIRAASSARLSMMLAR